MARYYEGEALLSAICRGCNEEFSDAPCEPSGCLLLMEIQNLPTADVVPKSEVDKWYHEYHAIKYALKQEKMYHRETEKLADKYFVELQTAKAEVAREIFEEIYEYCFDQFGYIDYNALAELKKKYTVDKK